MYAHLLIRGRFKSMGPGYLAHRILPPNMPEDIPASFMNDFLVRFKEEGLDEVSSFVFEPIR
jgi:hypothetical protein